MHPSPSIREESHATALPADVRAEVEARITSGRLELPVLPHVATQLLTTGIDESSDVGEISRLLHSDQALTGHVLRVANSAAYAGAVRIQSIQQALLRIGLTQLREIIVAVVMKSKVFRVDGYEDVVAALWRHSAVAGAYAKEIARGLRANTESAFLCGLLHDVGKPVLLALMLDLRGRDGAPLARATCLDALEPYHAVVGRALAERWDLPEAVAAAIAYHHDFRAAEQHGTAVGIACLANLLSHLALADGAGSDGASSDERSGKDERPGGDADEAALRAHPVAAALNLYPDDLDALIAKRDAMLALAEALAT